MSQLRPHEEVRLMRRIADLSQHDLAEKLGVSTALIALYESGERAISPERLEAIRKVCRPVMEKVARQLGILGVEA